MDKNQLDKGRRLQKEIEFLEKNIKDASYMISEEVKPRTTQIQWGNSEICFMDEDLWDTVGYMIVKHNKRKLAELKKQFEEL